MSPDFGPEDARYAAPRRAPIDSARAQRHLASQPVGDIAEAAWRKLCFYSTPMNKPGSDARKHSEAFLKCLVRPAIKVVDPTLKVVTSEELPSRLIRAGISECVARCRLMIADLSYHYPNVLHEVGLRDAKEKPLVLISRDIDPIPSNLGDMRTVLIGTNPWDILENRESYQRKIERYARWVLADNDAYYAIDL